MRYVVFGAGAIGGVVGGRLFESGHEVVLVARGAHAREIERSGLRIESPDGVSNLPVPVVTDPSEIDFHEGDVVLLGVKSQDTAAALAALRRSAPVSTAVACLQNGVVNEPVALRMFTHVYGVCVMCPATHLEPGVVVASSAPVAGLLDVGRYPSGTDAISADLAAAFRSSTFDAVERPDIMRWKYAKLLLNLGNAVEAVCGPSARLGPLARRVRDEGVACFEAAGIDFVSEAEDTARRGDLLTVRPVSGRKRSGGSTWQSLARGARSVETDYLTGEIVLLGRQHGVPTPANALLQELVDDLAERHGDPGSVAEEDVLAMLDSDVRSGVGLGG